MRTTAAIAVAQRQQFPVEQQTGEARNPRPDRLEAHPFDMREPDLDRRDRLSRSVSSLSLRTSRQPTPVG